MQDTLKVVVMIFRRLGLDTNLEKTKALVCIPRYIWVKWREAVYKHMAIGEGETFRERKRLRVS